MSSIYETIKENLTPQGRLPDDFIIPGDEAAPNRVRFIAGGSDGVGVYHFQPTNHPKVAAKIVHLLGSREYVKIPELLHQYRTVHLIDAVLNAILKHQNELNMEEVIKYAIDLIMDSEDIELVKFGIAVLSLFEVSEKELFIREAILTLGVCDEFTLFAAEAVKDWEGGNDLLFFLAQRVDGWGKIHLVERLEPETEEIRDWLLRSGCANDVMSAYLGLVCAEKGDLIGALRKDILDDGLFEGICVIFEGLLDEGPVPGMSNYDYAEEAIRLYLLHAAKNARTLKHLWYILNVHSWLENEKFDSKDQLLCLCAGITDRPSWRDLIFKAIQNPDDEHFFYAVNTAGRLDIDVDEMLFQAVIKLPIQGAPYLSKLYCNPDYAKRLTSIYEETLPLKDLASGMGDHLFASDHKQEHQCLEFVLMELKNYPGMGESLLQAALQSPVIRERNNACNALKKWSEALREPVLKIAPDTMKFLKEIADTEVNADTKKVMEQLIKNDLISPTSD